MTTTMMKGRRIKLRNIKVLAILCFGLHLLLTFCQFSVHFCHVLSVHRRRYGLAGDRALRSGAKSHETTVEHNDRAIQYIPTEMLSEELDIFAASWWQSKSRFLDFNASTIVYIEDDAFFPVLDAGLGIKDARMTLDWLDFSIEHLSKWWKEFEDQDQGVAFAVGKLQAYLQHALDKRDSKMESTLAIIPYGVNTKDPMQQRIWLSSLAATMASLLRNGVGRILVVGHYDTDEKLTLEAFRLLSRHDQNLNRTIDIVHHRNTSFSTTLGSTELAYVHTNDVDVKGVDFNHNVPKGALVGLQQALRNQRQDAKDWLGATPEKYKYIYMTESDQILHSRLSFRMYDELDNGGILIPHRLQPVPHPLDLNWIISNDKLVPVDGSFSLVVEQLGNEDSCCDSLTLDKPGLNDYPDCGNFWYLCGFMDGNHSRLSSYQWMRLSMGTGIVSLAATEHSRKCTPTKKGGCSAPARPLSIA